MTALTSQSAKLFYAADSSGSPSGGYTKVDGAVNIEAGAPIKGDIEATNLESTAIEMVDDLVEEMSYPVTIQSDFKTASHKALIAAQAAKTRLHFKIEIPEPKVTTVTTIIYYGWVRNFRWSATPRAVQQASFDILTRSAATIAHAAAAET